MSDLLQHKHTHTHTRVYGFLLRGGRGVSSLDIQILKLLTKYIR